MKAIIELKLSHGFTEFAIVSKKIEVPNVFGDEGLHSNIKLTSNITCSETLKPASVDLDTGVVTIQKVFALDVSEYVKKESLNDFSIELETQGWSTKLNQKAIGKLNEPPKPKALVKAEEEVKTKPKYRDWLYSFLIIYILAIVFTYIFNNEKFTLIYIVSFCPLFILATGIGHYLGVRKYNKAIQKVNKSKVGENV